MRSILGALVAGVWLAVATPTIADEAVRWSSDFNQACDTAARDRRLVLLHFYSDDCPPCVWMDKNVFTLPEVATALERYYVPVKLHVRHAPEIARKYNIQSWPTDVVVTPAGMEVYRTTGRKSAAEYLSIVEQVALHGGARPAAGGQVPVENAAPASGSPYPGPYQGGPVAGGYQSQLPPNDRTPYQSSIGQATHQNLDVSRSSYGGYQPQQGAAPDVAPTGNPLGPMAPAAANAAASTSAVAETRPRSPYLQPQYEGSAQANIQGQAPPSGSVYQPVAPQQPPMQSAFRPGLQGTPPATSGYAANPPSAQPPVSPSPMQQPIINRYAQSEPPPGATMSPGPQPSWGQTSPGAAPPVAASTPANAVGPYSMQPPASIAPASPVGQPPAPQMVSSADAPPVVLEGYCVVSMAETRKLKKADARFGAVHRGRTYLFISEAEQAKFLADPDRYAVILSGYDPVKFAKTGQLVEGKRQFGMIYQQKIYLMSDEESLNQFAASPQFFSTTAHQAMLKTETTGTQFR